MVTMSWERGWSQANQGSVVEESQKVIGRADRAERGFVSDAGSESTRGLMEIDQGVAHLFDLLTRLRSLQPRSLLSKG